MNSHECHRLAGYIRDAVQILMQSQMLYQQGQTCFYRVAAVQLRLLLCDTVRRHGQMISIALAPRLWNDLRFPALVEEEFEPKSLSIEDWLEQGVPGCELSVRQFIRCVCDQDGGAHVDMRLLARLPEGFQTADWIFRLSKIVVKELSVKLEIRIG